MTEVTEIHVYVYVHGQADLSRALLDYRHVSVTVEFEDQTYHTFDFTHDIESSNVYPSNSSLWTDGSGIRMRERHASSLQDARSQRSDTNKPAEQWGKAHRTSTSWNVIQKVINDYRSGKYGTHSKKNSKFAIDLLRACDMLKPSNH